MLVFSIIDLLPPTTPRRAPPPPMEDETVDRNIIVVIFCQRSQKAASPQNMQQQQQQLSIDASRECFPFCLVWTPIPVLTWIFPFIGHMGICNSQGLVYDFAGPYYIGEGELAFGRTTRYLKLNPSSAELWDKSVEESNACYARKMHQICFQNCHSHCATALDKCAYMGYTKWNMVILAAWMFFFGRFVSTYAFLVSVLPSILIWGAVIGLSYSVK